MCCWLSGHTCRLSLCTMQPILKVFKNAIANDTYNHSIGKVNKKSTKISLANDIAAYSEKYEQKRSTTKHS